MIGARGGRRSRRTLGSDTARAMVRVREARRAFRRFHAMCFRAYPPDREITAGDVPWVAERLMTHGDREAWRLGVRLITDTSDRRRMTARVVPLSSSEAADPRTGGTLAERLAAVSALSAEAWRLSGRPLPQYTRATMPIAIRRRAAEIDHT